MWWQFAFSTESNWFTQQERKGIVIDCNALFSQQYQPVLDDPVSMYLRNLRLNRR